MVLFTGLACLWIWGTLWGLFGLGLCLDTVGELVQYGWRIGGLCFTVMVMCLLIPMATSLSSF